jgi:hypothetical protein
MNSGPGGADCERIGDSLLAQPVAAGSSVAFVVLGALLLWRRRGMPAAQRRDVMTYAWLMVAVGVGSVVYHGPGWPGATLLHDVPIVLMLTLAVGTPFVRWVRGRPVLPGSSGGRIAAVGVLAAVALLIYIGGRTASPLCRPDSVVQLHGVWHVLAAATLYGWGSLLWPRVLLQR